MGNRFRVIGGVAMIAGAMAFAIAAFGGDAVIAATPAGLAKKAIRIATQAKTIARGAQATASNGLGQNVSVVQSPTVQDGSPVVSAQAACPAGTVIVGGGHEVGTFDSAVTSHPFGTSFYGVISVNGNPGSSNPSFRAAEATAFVLCAPLASASGASAKPRINPADQRAFDAAVAAAKERYSK